MKNTLLTLLFLTSIFNCMAQIFIDPATTVGIAPANTNIGTAWELNFSDEFNGTAVNTTKWNIDNSTTSRAARPGIGISSWFWKPANVDVANGNLILKVTKETTSRMHCGSINSNGKYQTTYGYFEASIKIADATKGTHTAFWLQGLDMGNVDGTGNDGAEIDIFESAWTGDYTKSVIHIDGYGTSAQANTVQFNTPGIHSGYHTWGMWWTSGFIKIYYDGVLKVTYNTAKWIPRVDEYLWLSDGASFGFPDGDPCFTSQALGFLTEANVDYIRVWKPQVATVVTEPNTSAIELKTLSNKLQIEAQSLISSVSIYDTLGRMLNKHFPETISTSIEMHTSGVFIVETQLENGELLRKKILINQ
jgi:beta-glucanase (GH16 family)